MIADLQAYVSRSYYNQSGAAIPFGSLVATDNTPTSNDQFAVALATSGTGVVGLAIDGMTFEGVVVLLLTPRTPPTSSLMAPPVLATPTHADPQRPFQGCCLERHRSYCPR